MRPLTLAVLMLLAACTEAPAASSPSSGDEAWTLVVVDGEPRGGLGISVAEALTHGPTDDLVSVTGALFVSADGTALLCDAIAESFPPQCGGDRIAVIGLDLATVDGMQTEGDVSWAESVVLLGSVE